MYLPESEAIVGRLGACQNDRDVGRAVYEELCESFGSGAVGSWERCAQIGKEIWEFLRQAKTLPAACS